MNSSLKMWQAETTAEAKALSAHTISSAYDITPRWIRVTASELNARYWPNGRIAKTYKRGDRLKVDGITTDGKWYRFWMYDPEGGECNGYIFKAYTELD